MKELITPWLWEETYPQFLCKNLKLGLGSRTQSMSPEKISRENQGGTTGIKKNSSLENNCKKVVSQGRVFLLYICKKN